MVLFYLFPFVAWEEHRVRKGYTYFYISKNITSYPFLLAFKIIESLHCMLKEDSNNATFCSDEIEILSAVLDNVNFDDVYFDEDDTETIIPVRLMAWRYRFKQHKAS